MPERLALGGQALIVDVVAHRVVVVAEYRCVAVHAIHVEVGVVVVLLQEVLVVQQVASTCLGLRIELFLFWLNDKHAFFLKLGVVDRLVDGSRQVFTDVLALDCLGLRVRDPRVSAIHVDFLDVYAVNPVLLAGVL